MTQSELRFQVTGLDCAGCARTVETGIARLPGVASASLDFAAGALVVRGDVSPEVVAGRVRELGYDVVDPAESEPAAASSHARAGGGLFSYLWGRRDTRLALFAALLILPGLIFDELLPGLSVHSPIFSLMSVAAMLLAGYPVARSAWRAWRVNHEITINLLMTVAAVGAVAIGATTEAGLVMVLFALGEALEGYTAGRARDAIGSLSALAPAEAVVLVRDGAAQPVEVRLPVEQLKVGDHVVVRPGERIPMDGHILAGQSAVNQAPITGESRPVDKAPGDEVYAGSVNGQGALEIEVSRPAADNTISRLIRMVEEAQERRAPTQRFVDRFARVYTPAVIVIAALVATLPPLLWGQPFWNPAPEVHGWLYRALALLVVACPCALVISTPVTIISAISNGARHGVVFKGGAFLEELSRVRVVVLDKTGTITRGEPSVVAIKAADCLNLETEFLPRNSVSNAPCANCDDLLALATAVERRSEHPLAQAVLAEAHRCGLADRYEAAQQVQALTGLGVTGLVNGRRITVGSHAYFDDRAPHPAYCDDIAATDALGYTTMLVSDGDDYRGYIAAVDTLREGGAEAVAELREQGYRLIMLTGDNEATARRIAAEAGLSEVRAGCMPADKVAAVRELRATHGHVAMVGDGVNDAPAFAASSVGVAIGRTAQALETADVVLLGDDLRRLPFAFRLSRSAMNTVRVNVALSLLIKLAFFLLVLVGLGSMWLAVLADMGVSLLVTANGMRLLRRPRPADE